MNEGTPRSIMTDSNSIDSSQRRRSPRLSSPQAQSDNKMALPSLAVKRSITVRKIAPRKTVALSEQNKENTPRPSSSEGIQQKKPKVSTPGPVPGRESSSSSAKKKKATMPSPILPSSPPPASHTPQMDPEDAVWSQKVRRSYSKLSENSFNSPESRETLFGFEKLKTPEVRRAGVSKFGLEVSAGSFTGLNSFTSLLEADDCGGSAFPEPDPDIPGVAVVKERRRRRKKKVQQIDTTELDALAAKMNAEFDQAEEFELVVE